jgi:hypothetical protein
VEADAITPDAPRLSHRAHKLAPGTYATRIVFSRAGRVLSPAAISGAVDVIAEAHQMPPLAVPSPWDRLPVTAARVRRRVRRAGATVRASHTPIDLGRTLLPREAYGDRRIQLPRLERRLWLARPWIGDEVECLRQRPGTKASALGPSLVLELLRIARRRYSMSSSFRSSRGRASTRREAVPLTRA